MSYKEYAMKGVLYVSAFAVASMTFLYCFQDKMLYLPDAPIRHILDNPKGYRSPEERRILFKEVSVKVSNTELDVINGWYMQHLN